MHYCSFRNKCYRVTRFLSCCCSFLLLMAIDTDAQTAANVDEAKVGNYVLPPLLQTPYGKKIRNKEEWEKHQRPAHVQLFRGHVFGRIPGRPADMKFTTVAN